MKKYVLIVSERFPATHKRAGEDTNFIQQIKDGVKKHTIRGNYDLWKKRIDQIQAGKAYLSVRIWTGKPYNSKQKEILQLTEVGIQELEDPTNFVYASIAEYPHNWETVAKNDGLSFDDFCEWFNIRQKESMAIIHFTDFRY